MDAPAPIGTRVFHTERREYGTIEEYNTAGQPCVRYDYGNLLRASLDNLEAVCEN
jgi:hypothetical protein